MMAVTEKVKAPDYEGSVCCLRYLPDGFVEVQDMHRVSAGDGKRLATIKGIGNERMLQSCLAMSYLNDRMSRKTAFRRLVNSTTMLAEQCEMYPREVIVRHACGMGSDKERHPDHKPGWFADGPQVEFFHKKTLDVRDAGNPQLLDGNDLRRELGRHGFNAAVEGGVLIPDPLILYRDDTPGLMFLYDPHETLDVNKPLLVLPRDVTAEIEAEMAALAMEAFKLLSLAVGSDNVDCAVLSDSTVESLVLADIKFEFGKSLVTRKVTLGDMVSLDCLRILKNGMFDKSAHISKQVFRDGMKEDDVLKVYKLGTEIFGQF